MDEGNEIFSGHTWIRRGKFTEGSSAEVFQWKCELESRRTWETKSVRTRRAEPRREIRHESGRYRGKLGKEKVPDLPIAYKGTRVWVKCGVTKLRTNGAGYGSETRARDETREAAGLGAYCSHLRWVLLTYLHNNKTPCIWHFA